MERLKLIRFVAGHTTELQGLRTALIGAIFVAMALWQAALISTYSGSGSAAHKASWLPLILIAWHVDERLAMYYRQRVGDVAVHRPYSRLISLMAMGFAYITLRFWELAADLQFGLAALFIAAVHAHIALLSGEHYRRYYGFKWRSSSAVAEVFVSRDTRREAPEQKRE